MIRWFEQHLAFDELLLFELIYQVLINKPSSTDSLIPTS